MTDTTQPQAVTRLTGTLESTFGVFVSYLIQVGTTGASGIFNRLAFAIATGIIPYIDGRDNILDRLIAIERRRNDVQDQQIQDLDRRVTALENRIGSFLSSLQALSSQVSAVQQVANRSAQLAEASFRQADVSEDIASTAQTNATRALTVASQAQQLAGVASDQAQFAFSSLQQTQNFLSETNSLIQDFANRPAATLPPLPELPTIPIPQAGGQVVTDNSPTAIQQRLQERLRNLVR